ncbi:MAG: hypothetical protein APR53_10235 [Methanoculleus sp. SDB]|nr:MAG: hypothetical protein APR53_10235 [Methanoculleus sp. SDB]
MVRVAGGKNSYLKHRLRELAFLAVLSTVFLILLGWVVHPLFLIGIPVSLTYLAGKYRAYRAGIRGEDAVAVILEGFDDRYTLFNGVRLPGADGDIDHVLVGPKGIFVIETKNYRGFVACRGDAWYRKVRDDWIPLGRSPSKQAKYNASVLNEFLTERHLGEWVYAVVVFVNTSMKSIFEDTTVDIVYGDELRAHILAYPNILTPDRAEEIASALITATG